MTILKYLLLSFTNSLLRLTEPCQEIPVQVKNKTTMLFQGLFVNLKLFVYRDINQIHVPG